jgi:hypothetical protein
VLNLSIRALYSEGTDSSPGGGDRKQDRCSEHAFASWSRPQRASKRKWALSMKVFSVFKHQSLLRNQADITALMWAAVNNNADLVKTLLKGGALVNAQTEVFILLS